MRPDPSTLLWIIGWVAIIAAVAIYHIPVPCEHDCPYCKAKRDD